MAYPRINDGREKTSFVLTMTKKEQRLTAGSKGGVVGLLGKENFEAGVEFP